MERSRLSWAAWFVSLTAVTSAKEDMRKEAAMTPCGLVRYHGYPLRNKLCYYGRRIQAPYDQGSSRNSQRAKRLQDFLFADSGYDVWAMSNRESSHISNSTRYSQRDPRHWKWSFDELGRYDLAACIDHVLKVTGAPKLTTVALSQGVIANLVLHSVRPEYNNKVDLLVAYGPVGNLTHIESPTSVLIPHVPSLMRLVYPFTMAGFLGTSRGLRSLISGVCTLWGGTLCALGFTMTSFCSPEQFNTTRIPMYMGHMPTGTTVQNLLHFHQVYKAKNFVMYDHGPTENLRRYGQRTPPPYPLDRIRLPIALFWSYGDTLAGEHDVGTMAAALGSNVILNYPVPVRTFRHLDFATGYRANELLHNVALELIRKRIGRNL
ncbi:hypothetical protein MRX96_008401 [Rhipicephalus microplus]